MMYADLASGPPPDMPTMKALAPQWLGGWLGGWVVGCCSYWNYGLNRGLPHLMSTLSAAFHQCPSLPHLEQFPVLRLVLPVASAVVVVELIRWEVIPQVGELARYRFE